jgi:cysteine desulfurase/selenocysteine lyase
MLRKKDKAIQTTSDRLPEFGYLKTSDVYMDSACQSLRPQPVIDALNSYYHDNNACGERVKYKWGQIVDSHIIATRQAVLDYLKLSKKDYICSFALNTTAGINLILNQLPAGYYQQVVTSEIEHNSVFLPTMELAKRLNIKRLILKRDKDGSLIYTKSDIEKAIVVVNATSNIDGRQLVNIKQLINDVHNAGGKIIIDAAQAVAHYSKLLEGCPADAFCFSAHKMYASSLGVIVIRKDLLRSLDIKFVGGGMVTSVKKDSFELLPDEPEAWLEPGLQAYGEIMSLEQSIKWLGTVRPDGLKPADYVAKLSKQFYDGLKDIPNLQIFNQQPASVISLSSKTVDSSRLAVFLSDAGIMARSGYFCCHYYLIEQLKKPQLLRFSLGIHNTEADITKTLETLKKFAEI